MLGILAQFFGRLWPMLGSGTPHLGRVFLQLPMSTFTYPATDFRLPLRLPLALGGYVLGVALQLQQAALWPSAVYFGLVGVAGLAFAILRRRFWGAGAGLAGRWATYHVVLLCACGLLGWGTTGVRAQYFARSTLSAALEGQDIQVRGVVVDMPQRNASGVRFRLGVEAATLAGQAVELPPRIDLGWYGSAYTGEAAQADALRPPQDLQAGERWTMTVRLKAPHGSRNPFGFDYELWLWEQGVQAMGYVRTGLGDPPPQRLDQTWKHPVALARQMVRARIFQDVPQRQAAGLIAALVVGDQAAIDRVDWDVFRATGVAHLVSISGLHITMFAWGAALLIGYAWRRSARLCLWVAAPMAAILGGVCAAVAYALFSGWGIPAQRTCVMLATVGLLRCLGARWPWPLVWLLACAVVVACDPWALLQSGFWLSFVAVGVLFATASFAPLAHAPPPMLAHATRPPEHPAPTTGGAALHASGPHAWGMRVLQVVREGAREQWTISLALAPLTLMLFGQFSVVGLVANAFAIPWVTLVVTPLAMLGTVLPWVWDGAVVAIQGWMALLQFLAALPWATVALPVAPLWVGGAGVAGGLLLVARLPWPLRLGGVALVLPVLLWQAPVPQVGEFELMAADVGQGNAVLVRTASHALLYDAGPRYSLESDAGHRVIVPLLQALQTRLDTVVLSHRDIDHVGGAPAVLAMQPQAHVISSMADGSAVLGNRAVERCQSGQGWEWDGVRFDILHPQAGDYSQAPRPNAISCVLRISNGLRTALLVGDIEQAQEQALVDSQAPLAADVLLVPHHGSKTSSSEAFLDAVHPAWGLVQAGYRNRFGHPAATVVERYRERQIAVRDSPHCGAMTWRSHAPHAVACTRMERQRYWNHQVPG